MPKFRVTEVCRMKMFRTYEVEADDEDHIERMNKSSLLWDMAESQSSGPMPDWDHENGEYTSGPYIDSITEVH